MAERESKEPLDRGKEESGKAGLKLNTRTKTNKKNPSTLKKLRSWLPVPLLEMTNRWGKNGNIGRFYFLGIQHHCK